MIELTKDAKVFHRLWSFWPAALVVVVSFLELTMPAWQEILSAKQYAVLVIAFTASGQVLRFIRQKKLSKEVNGE